jgi:ketosteroid isomerase-like protein
MMAFRVEADPTEVLPQLQNAMNRHDLEAFLACFDSNYRSEQPAHPNRGFGGREQVQKNWTALFDSIPDFHADLLATSTQGETTWAEWHWSGTRADGTPLDMRGVTLFGVKDGQIVWGRLYMEDVEEVDEDIDEAVRRMAGRSGATKPQ